MTNDELKRLAGKCKAWGIFLIAAFCLLPSAFGDLVVTVVPGYVFSPNEAPTVTTLNMLATPTVYVTGTLGGTNVAIAAGSITGTMLSSTVVDDVTLGFNGGAPPAIYVLNQGITDVQLSTNCFTSPLVGGNGSPVQVLYDNVTIKTNAAGKLYVPFTNLPPLILVTNLPASTNGPALYGHGTNTLGQELGVLPGINITNGQVGLTQFTSTNITVPGGQWNGFTVAIPHGLASAAGGVPTWIRWVLVDQTAEVGYSPGQEVDVMSSIDNNSTGPHFTVGCDTTNAFIVASSGNNVQLFNYSTGTRTSLTPGNWKLKVYVRP